MSVVAPVRLAQANGRRLVFDVSAADERDTIARGVHERFCKRAAAKGRPINP